MRQHWFLLLVGIPWNLFATWELWLKEVFYDCEESGDYDEETDSIFALRMPRAYEIRKWRSGDFSGLDTALLHSVPDQPGIWTCLLPSLIVTSINLNDKASVSTGTQGKKGVTYTLHVL